MKCNMHKAKKFTQVNKNIHYYHYKDTIQTLPTLPDDFFGISAVLRIQGKAIYKEDTKINFTFNDDHLYNILIQFEISMYLHSSVSVDSSCSR